VATTTVWDKGCSPVSAVVSEAEDWDEAAGVTVSIEPPPSPVHYFSGEGVTPRVEPEAPVPVTLRWVGEGGSLRLVNEAIWKNGVGRGILPRPAAMVSRVGRGTPGGQEPATVVTVPAGMEEDRNTVLFDKWFGPGEPVVSEDDTVMSETAGRAASVSPFEGLVLPLDCEMVADQLLAVEVPSDSATPSGTDAISEPGVWEMTVEEATVEGEEHPDLSCGIVYGPELEEGGLSTAVARPSASPTGVPQGPYLQIEWVGARRGRRQVPQPGDWAVWDQARGTSGAEVEELVGELEDPDLEECRRRLRMVREWATQVQRHPREARGPTGPTSSRRHPYLLLPRPARPAPAKPTQEQEEHAQE
jgi:hypothetical protein